MPLLSKLPLKSTRIFINEPLGLLDGFEGHACPIPTPTLSPLRAPLLIFCALTFTSNQVTLT